MEKEKNKTSFEQSLKRLEKILESLEGEDISLEDTLRLYEEGLTLTKLCQDKLNQAELRIKEITKSANGSFDIKDFK